MSAAATFRISYEDYLRLEESSDFSRHEWCDGVVYAMSHGTPEHARLMARISTALQNALEGKCEVYASAVMIYVEEARLSTYADATVVCGPLQTKKTFDRNGKSMGEAMTNPVVIVEVLSDATERYDRDGKFQAYKRIASFEEYVLVSQDERKVEVFRRARDWAGEAFGAGEVMAIQGMNIAVDAVYG